MLGKEEIGIISFLCRACFGYGFGFGFGFGLGFSLEIDFFCGGANEFHFFACAVDPRHT